eukprot:m.57888 g.57888  ORF g.57888 m.57888 type:complete len:124 (-) comp11639_c1_seq1:2745-3116(-)
MTCRAHTVPFPNQPTDMRRQRQLYDINDSANHLFQPGQSKSLHDWRGASSNADECDTPAPNHMIGRFTVECTLATMCSLVTARSHDKGMIQKLLRLHALDSYTPNNVCLSVCFGVSTQPQIST